MAWSYIEKIIIETKDGLIVPYDASIQEGNLKRLRRIQEAEHDHTISYIKSMEIYTRKFKITFFFHGLLKHFIKPCYNVNNKSKEDRKWRRK